MTGSATWSTPTIVREKAQSWWRGGRLLRELHAPSDPPLFPARIRLIRPSAAEVGERFAEVRAWADTHARAAAKGGWTVQTRRVPIRALGPQDIPSALVVPDARVALSALGPGAAGDAATFARCLAESDHAGEWARVVALAHPLRVVGAADDWPALLRVTAWVVDHPRPGVHVRALPLPGVHSKLVEANRVLLMALLSQALPADAVDAGARTFEDRFGFATGERTAVLSAAGPVVGLPHLATAEVTWPVSGLEGLDPVRSGIAEVVVVENRACLDMVPHHPARAVVWGAGYGAADLLVGVRWLPTVTTTYWGDIDTHGLAILSDVRAVVPHIRSALMDLDTLQEHRERAGREQSPRADIPAHLTARERALYERLLRTGERLEQEHLPASAVAAAFPPAARTADSPPQPT